jgi:hypothetical protein
VSRDASPGKFWHIDYRELHLHTIPVSGEITLCMSLVLRKRALSHWASLSREETAVVFYAAACFNSRISVCHLMGSITPR